MAVSTTCGICGKAKVARSYLDRTASARGVRTIAFFCHDCDFNGTPPWRVGG